MPTSISRRQFFAVPAAVGVGALLPAGLLAALESATPPTPDLSDWDKVRAQFALDPNYAHFASFFIASHPAPVRAAIDAYRSAMDRNPFLVIERGMFEGDDSNVPLRVQQSVAAYVGGDAHDICLTRSTTESLALVYHGLPLKPGDEVLTTLHDHYSHHESIRMACERSGATMRKIPLFAEASKASTDSLVDALLKGVGANTRVVGLTWVHSATGIRLPIREMAAALKRKHPEMLLVLDGVHGIGAVDETIATMGPDFVCAGCHKWMFAPRGTAMVWARPEQWARLRPLVPTFSEWESYDAWTQNRVPKAPTNAARMSPGGFHAFEHQWAMAAAFDMHMKMGRPRVAARIRSLNDRLKTQLAQNKKITLHTPMSGDLSAGLVAFEVAGVSPENVVKRLLDRQIVASTSPYAVSYARLAASLVNTPEEVDRAVREVHAIAG